jgi:hypothetical protein
MNDILLARLERLERQNRTWRLAALSLLLVLAGGAAMQKPADVQPTQTLTLQKLVLVDAQGNHRALLSSDKEGAFLVFTGNDGTVRLGLAGTEPRLDTFDASKNGWKNWLRREVEVVPAR